MNQYPASVVSQSLTFAAPDLYAALVLMVEGFAQYAEYGEEMRKIGRGFHPVVGNGVNHEMVERIARAALARAEGE